MLSQTVKLDRENEKGVYDVHGMWSNLKEEEVTTQCECTLGTGERGLNAEEINYFGFLLFMNEEIH